MYVYIKQLGIVCLLCWLGLSCTLQRTEHPALRQAGYLMEEHSDSAFSLLKSISSLTGMSPEDKAGYALLLAVAYMLAEVAVTVSMFIIGRRQQSGDST